MLRYYAIATVLVLAFVALISVLPRETSTPREQSGGPLPTALATGSPTPARGQDDGPEQLPAGAIARAPWALSVLPDCFEQRSRARGSAAFVRSKLPSGLAAARVRAGFEVRAGECRVRVYRTSAIVRRGKSLLFVPPEARVYVLDTQIAILALGDGRGELRMYRTVGNVVPEVGTVGPPLECAALANACLRATRAAIDRRP